MAFTFCPGTTCMMASGSTMFKPVKVEPEARNRPSPSCAAKLRIVNLVNLCLSIHQTVFRPFSSGGQPT